LGIKIFARLVEKGTRGMKMGNALDMSISTEVWLSESCLSTLEAGQPDACLGLTSMNLLPTPALFGGGEKGKDDEQK
jgi:hypothetical protein